jgi:tRNA U34 5-carboxymethylaminomethyl modifying enzyme MnmG/GidA
MHSEIRAQAARTQTIEILLFELQTQQGAVNRATQRVDNAKERLAEVQEGLGRSSAEIARAEDVLRAASSETDKATAESELNRLKNGSTSFKRMEQDRLFDQQQADAQLRKAQITYDTIQDELNRVMKALQAEQPPSR